MAESGGPRHRSLMVIFGSAVAALALAQLPWVWSGIGHDRSPVPAAERAIPPSNSHASALVGDASTVANAARTRTVEARALASTTKAESRQPGPTDADVLGRDAARTRATQRSGQSGGGPHAAGELGEVPDTALERAAGKPQKDEDALRRPPDQDGRLSAPSRLGKPTLKTTRRAEPEHVDCSPSSFAAVYGATAASAESIKTALEQLRVCYAADRLDASMFKLIQQMLIDRL
jgi:hypothetical protein